MKSTGLRYQVLLLVFCIVSLPWAASFFVWGVCRGSVVPEGLQLDLKKTRNMKSTGLRYQGLLLVFCIVFCCLELPFLEQWFRKGSNLIAIRLTRWNPGVWGIWRGSLVPEGFQLDFRKTRNMKSTGLRYQGLLLVFWCILHCFLLPWALSRLFSLRISILQILDRTSFEAFLGSIFHAPDDNTHTHTLGMCS